MDKERPIVPTDRELFEFLDNSDMASLVKRSRESQLPDDLDHEKQVINNSYQMSDNSPRDMAVNAQDEIWDAGVSEGAQLDDLQF